MPTTTIQSTMDTPAPATAAAQAPSPAPAPSPAVTAVVNARFCAPEPTAFAVARTIGYTERDYTVTDAAGAAVMKVEAAAFAFLMLSKKSLLLDAARRPVLTMQDSGYLMGSRWAVFRGDSTSRRNLLFTVVKSSVVQVRTKIFVFLAGNAAEEAPDFVIRGSYYDGACTVSPGNSDATIAQITRRNTAQMHGFGRNIYTARINPVIDRAFIFALTVILDEMH